MKEGDFYNGRPEHQSPAKRMEIVRSHIEPPSPEKLQAQRASMAHARAAKARKHAKLVARRIHRAAQAQRISNP